MLMLIMVDKKGIKYKLKSETLTESILESIYATIEKLPAKVQKYVLDKVIFIENNDATATAVQSKRRESFVLIDEEEFERYPESYRQFTVAHEIAHIWLKHTTERDVYSDEEYNAMEKEADKLTKKWGFKKPSEKAIKLIYKRSVLLDAVNILAQELKDIESKGGNND